MKKIYIYVFVTLMYKWLRDIKLSWLDWWQRWIIDYGRDIDRILQAATLLEQIGKDCIAEIYNFLFPGYIRVAFCENIKTKYFKTYLFKPIYLEWNVLNEIHSSVYWSTSIYIYKKNLQKLIITKNWKNKCY